jgi:homoserine kinase
MALEFCNTFTVDTLGPGETPSVQWDGEGSGELPTDGTDLVSTSLAHMARVHRTSLPPLRLHGVNQIPLERGLGSSSSAVVAGVLLADAILGLALSADGLLAAAVEVEGHPDNVAPALRGGLILSYRSKEGWRAESLPLSNDLRPVALIPRGERIPTEEARRVLPDQVSREDAIFNASRAALVVHALGARPDLLRDALEDRLHQDARLALVPAVQVVFERLLAAGIPVCVSGAGPTLLAFETDERPMIDLGQEWELRRLVPRLRGASLRQDPIR